MSLLEDSIFKVIIAKNITRDLLSQNK